jgi:mono/diheme cytochrome c family protein
MRKTSEQMQRLTGSGLQGRRRLYLIGIALLFSLIATVGCAQGTYPLDIFYEMHYQQSYSPHEPPRLSAPASAVAWFPPPKATSFTDDGQHLYLVNCSMCHGVTGAGDGPVLQRMMSVYGYQPAVPPNLTAPPATALGVAGVQGFITNGVVVMPSFANVLTPEARTQIAEYVVNCLQGVQPQDCPQ